MNLPREIGSFEILEPLGAGGMGEVLKARDKRLNRFVAVKFLPQAASPLARERFQREALAVAALNHPNICTLHETGEHAGQPYLVMELLEGETLFARLQRGPVALAQIVQWGSEVADALEAAHAKGILHRDLKPANIFITPRGAAKVLDFGLAQITAAVDAEAETFAGSQAGAAGMPPLTAPGSTMGTYAYMSPEQARGEPTDARSDIFSLGVVLYEMAGGKPPFRGRTTADLTAAILMLAPPPPSSLRPEIPPRLDDIIAQCLEKDPSLRYQNAADLRLSLRRLLGPSSSATAPAAVAAMPAAKRRRWLWPAIAAAIIIVAGLAFWRLRAPAVAAPTLSFHQLTFNGQVIDAAISPDGKFLAYAARGPAGTSLHLLSTVNGSDAQIMPPALGCCSAPSFSPDGSLIYFRSGPAIKTVPVLGGAVRTVVGRSCSGATVSPNGNRIAYMTIAPGGDALTVAHADGTQARVLSHPHPDAYESQCWGQSSGEQAWSPDGRWIAVIDATPHDSHVALVNAANGRRRFLGPDLGGVIVSGLAWLPHGDGVVFTESMAAASPSQAWEVTYPGGKLVQLTHDLQGYRHASVAAQAGEIALVHSNPLYSVWTHAKRSGAFQQLPGGGASLDGKNGLAWTPQGRILSVRAPGGKSQLWLEGGGAAAQMLAVSNLPQMVGQPAVAPNGQIVFTGADGGGNGNLWRVDADGTNLTDLTPGTDGTAPELVEGGATLAFQRQQAVAGATHLRVWTVPLAGGAARMAWAGDTYGNVAPLALPGGKRVLVLVPDANEPHGSDLDEVAVDGSKPVMMPELFARLRDARIHSPYALTPDGRALTGVVTAGSVDNIWALPLKGGRPYAITHFTDLGIAAYAFSKDGRLAVSRGSANSDAVLATGLVKKP